VCALSLSLKHDFSSASDDDVSLLWSNTAQKIGIAGGWKQDIDEIRSKKYAGEERERSVT